MFFRAKHILKHSLGSLTHSQRHRTETAIERNGGSFGAKAVRQLYGVNTPNRHRFGAIGSISHPLTPIHKE